MLGVVLLPRVRTIRLLVTMVSRLMVDRTLRLAQAIRAALTRVHTTLARLAAATIRVLASTRALHLVEVTGKCQSSEFQWKVLSLVG